MCITPSGSIPALGMCLPSNLNWLTFKMYDVDFWGGLVGRGNSNNQSVWGNTFTAWQASYEGRLRREEEQEQARLRQILGLLQLPRRAVPRVWEDLASVLSRTARKM